MPPCASDSKHSFLSGKLKHCSFSYFDLEEEGFDFDDEDLVDDFALVCFVGVEVDFLCDEVDTFFV